MHPKRGSNNDKGFKIYFVGPFFYTQDLSKVFISSNKIWSKITDVNLINS